MIDVRWKITGPDNKERTETDDQALAFRLWREGGCKKGRQDMIDLGMAVKIGARSLWRWKEQLRWNERDEALKSGTQLDWAEPTEEDFSNVLDLVKVGSLEKQSDPVKQAHLALVDHALQNWERLLRLGRIKMSSPKDLETLIKTRMMITGEDKKPAGGGGPGNVVIQVITNIPRPEVKVVDVEDAEVIDAEIENV